MPPDSRAAILARRARFVAAAVASLGFAAGCEKGTGPGPQTCLSAAEPRPDPSTEVEPPTTASKPKAPVPCLEPMQPDAGTADAGRHGDGGLKKQLPSICLSDDTY